MLNWTKTRMVWSEPRPVLSTSLGTIQEGMAAVSCIEAGAMKAKASDGSTSGLAARLLGIFMSPRRTASQNVTSVVVTAPAGGGSVLLPNLVLSQSDVGVFNAATGVQLAASTSAAASNNVQVSTDSVTGLTALTFDSTNGGTVFNVFYGYTMSPAVEVSLYGDTSPGFYASDLLGSVGIFKIGKIATNCFDPQANWYSGTNGPNVKVIAGGLFTDTGSSAAGFTATNATIVGLPTPSSPWLELELNA